MKKDCCIQKFKNCKCHFSTKTKAKTYGQVKALAHSFDKHCIVGLYDKPTNIGIEAHLEKINLARTDRKKYKRNTKDTE